MRARVRHVRSALTVLLLAATSGCGDAGKGGAYPVRGKVIVDGKPAERVVGSWWCSSCDKDPASGRGPARGRQPTKPLVVGDRRRVDEIAASLPAGAWRRVVVGEGSQGPRVCEYAEVPVWFCEDQLPGPGERLLVYRSLSQEPELKYHRSNAPAEVPLEKLAQVRGVRWTIEEDIQSCKGECGLDEYETRGWVGWHHHTALSMLALAFLVLRKHQLGGKKSPR